MAGILRLFSSASHFAELARIGDDHAYFLLIGKLDGIPDSALTGSDNDQRLRAFQHRQHGLIFQIGLESFFLGSFGFLIAARVFEEFFQLPKLGLIVLLGIRTNVLAPGKSPPPKRRIQWPE